MSGICAVWRRDSLRATETLASLNAGLSLAAEERQSLHADGAVAVGASARFASQQSYRKDHLLLACDAELTNETELAETVGVGKSSEGSATAATLALLYEKHGCSFVEKLRGGFSVVLWDARERRFLAAIDGFGIKRLVYYQNSKVLLAATRIDALTRCEDVDLQINPSAITNVLNFSANLGPGTIFKKVQRLIPGAMLVATERDTRVEKYWDVRYGVGANASEAQLSREMESVIQGAVAGNCKREFQELGAFLSGGTDSSTVVGLMSRCTQSPVKAFSIGFQEERFNELEYAEIAAKRFGSKHYIYRVTPQDCFESLPQIVRYFDEPYGNSSAIPTYFCSRLAAQNGVKILLAGDGGDELFGGNERYATDKIFEYYHYVPGFLRKGMLEPFLSAVPVKGGVFRRARGYVRRANLPGVERLLSGQFLGKTPPAEIFEGDFLRELGDYSVAEIPARHYSQAGARDHLDRLLYVDLKITLADNDLPKVTCMTEMAGIQARFPFLDRDVVEFSGRIPARLKVKGFEKRYLFKRAFRELLPIEIIRKKKHGFGIPVGEWINSDRDLRALSRDTLLSSRATGRGYFRREYIEDLFRKSEREDATYYGDTIWTFLTLELWHRQVMDAPARKTV